MKEDVQNQNGASYSYIVPGRNVHQTFLDVLIKIIGETLVKTENYNEVTGVSLVPKRGSSCLKIWLRNRDNQVKLKVNDIHELKNGRFQIHKEMDSRIQQFKLY